MHTRRMYWAHRFHHRFNSVVVPVTANAVSIAEYAIAVSPLTPYSYTPNTLPRTPYAPLTPYP